MPHDWMIDVLDDLRRYAELNGMATLAEQIGTTLNTAQDEIARSGAGQGGDLRLGDMITPGPRAGLRDKRH